MFDINQGAIFSEGIKYIRLIGSGRVLPFHVETARLVSKNEAEFVEFKNGEFIKFLDKEDTKQTSKIEIKETKQQPKQESKPKAKVMLDFDDPSEA